MSWSTTPNDRSGGRRKRARRGPRWVTDHAREIAEQQRQPEPPRPPARDTTRDSARDTARDTTAGRRWMPQRPVRRQEPDHGDDHYGAAYGDPGYADPPRRRAEPPSRHAGGYAPPRRPERHDDLHHRDEPRRRATDRHDDPGDDRHPDDTDDYGDGYRRSTYRDAPRDLGDRRDDRDPRDRDPRDRASRDRDARAGDARGRDPRDRDPRDRDPRDRDARDRRDDDRRDDDRPRGSRPRDGHPAEHDESGTGPRKLTVTRVAAWRSRQLTQLGIAAFRRAATADGADRSGLTGLTYPTMLNYGADAAIAVALANTLFFSAATAESKTKVALYLLITVAPFALIAPVIGPMLDRLQRGRRLALGASFAGRAVLAMVMAQHFDDWLLYPAALGVMVLSRSFNVLKAAVTPRLLPPDITLTKVNSRLAMFGLAAGAVIGGAAGGFAVFLGSAGALWFTVVVCLVGGWLCLRIPGWVEVTEGEVPASLRDHHDDERQTDTAGRRRREPLGRHVVVALWGNGTIRVLTGFMTLFMAFVAKAQAGQSAWQQVLLLGMVGVAAGVGSMAGNAIGARQHFNKPDQVIITCVSVVLGVSVLAALVGGIGTAVLVALVGSVCSALAKVCQDAVIQNDMSEASRASAFGRTETILQLSWTLGGALGVLLPPTYWLGFAVISGVLALGTAQTVVTQRGGSLIPRFGGDRPARPSTATQPDTRPPDTRPPDNGRGGPPSVTRPRPQRDAR